MLCDRLSSTEFFFKVGELSYVLTAMCGAFLPVPTIKSIKAHNLMQASRRHLGVTFSLWPPSPMVHVFKDSQRPPTWRSQRDVYLGWPIAPLYVQCTCIWAQMRGGGGGGLRGLSQWVQLCIWSPNKLRRSNSIRWRKTYCTFLRRGGGGGGGMRNSAFYFTLPRPCQRMQQSTLFVSSWKC